MPKSVEAAIGISQPLPVPTGPVPPENSPISLNAADVIAEAESILTQPAQTWRIRTQPVEIVNPYRVFRRRGGSRGSRGHSSRRCGVCEECRSSKGSFVRNRCRGGMLGSTLPSISSGLYQF